MTRHTTSPVVGTARSKPITDADIERMADEAEAGYDIATLRPRGGRPPMGSGPAEVVPVRLDPELRAAVEARATGERADGAPDCSPCCVDRDKMHQSCLMWWSAAQYHLEMTPNVASGLAAGGPPPFVRLASHPLRWRLLRELVHSDRAVRELMMLVGEPQSLVSYHLRLLRDGGLVAAHRSSADGRDSYYAIDLIACRDALQSAGGALHPALRLEPAVPEVPRARSAHRRPSVLFLCTGNSARSQIAEALLEHISVGAVRSASAGSHPKRLHPNAVRVLRTYGIDISANRTKHLDELRSQRFDTVVTLCDRVRTVCPQFPSRPELVHWSVADPALAGANDRASYPAFERTAAELETRIRFRLPLFNHSDIPRRSASVQ